MIFSRTYGEGIPLIIVHGLFGMSDNWNTLGKNLLKILTFILLIYEIMVDLFIAMIFHMT